LLGTFLNVDNLYAANSPAKNIIRLAFGRLMCSVVTYRFEGMLLLTVVYLSQYMICLLDVIQPVAPLADSRRGSSVTQGGVSRPNVIDDSERSVITVRIATMPFTTHAISSVSIFWSGNSGLLKE